MQSLLVFLKYPAAGRVKTRLADSIGGDRAAELYRRWIEIVLSQVQPLRTSTRLVACYDGAPADAFAAWHALADDWWPQPDGGLGDRLAAAFDHWQRPGDAAVAIGTDCLELEASHIETAFATLRERDVVFGPATDGGYYLVGLARHLPNFFHGVPWSTSRTLAAHRAICTRNRWSVGLLPSLDDIDTLEDWQHYQQRATGPS